MRGRKMMLVQISRMTLMVAAWGMLAGPGALGQDARTLHAIAESESNQEKQVGLLCKAADLAPTNAGYRNDCDTSKRTLLSGDKQMLKNAQDAIDAGRPIQAIRFLGMVSSMDPDLHHQAEQLLQKLSKPKEPDQAPLLAQAKAAYTAGNFDAVRSAVQQISDPALKAEAAGILANISHYNDFVAAGKRYEGARQFAEAESAYQNALALGPRVPSDNLPARVAAVHQAGVATPGTQVATNNTPGNTDPGKKPISPVPPPSPPTAEEKKKRLLDEGWSALSRNDLDLAGRRFKQVLDLDASNADAKRGLGQITMALNKDPVQLEMTLREAIAAFYALDFDTAESRFNRYLGADSGKKKGAAYFYLGATETTLAILDDASKRTFRNREALEDFKQARLAGYQPIDKYVSSRVLAVWRSSNM